MASNSILFCQQPAIKMILAINSEGMDRIEVYDSKFYERIIVFHHGYVTANLFRASLGGSISDVPLKLWLLFVL